MTRIGCVGGGLEPLLKILDACPSPLKDIFAVSTRADARVAMMSAA